MFITGDQVEGALIMSVLLGVGKIISIVRGDGNKRMDTTLEEKRIALKADEQESIQDGRIAPFYQTMILETNTKVNNLEIKLESALDNIKELSIRLAKAETTAAFLEKTVKSLEEELEKAKADATLSRETIISLQTQLAVKDTELIAAHDTINLLRYNIRQINLLGGNDTSGVE